MRGLPVSLFELLHNKKEAINVTMGMVMIERTVVSEKISET